MTHLRRTINWTLAVGGCLVFAVISLIQADPSDDFSFSLAHSSEIEAYNLMSEHRVAQIFGDRLDLFPKSELPKLSKYFLNLCKQYRFDPAFVLSLIEVESSFRIRAVSPVGAVGLMQVMPATAEVIIRDGVVDYAGTPAQRALMDPYFNLKLGIAYLAILREKYQGRPPYYLVAAYNVGPARLDQLLSRKNFKPVKTKKYFEDIRRRVPDFRFYQRGQIGV